MVLASAQEGVVFDLHGMQVDWATVVAIAATKKIDLWVLVPLGQAIIRLPTAKQPPEGLARALTRFFGNEDWRQYFYPTKQAASLFGDDEIEVRDVDFQRIRDYVVTRFKTVFAEVLDEPLLLRKSRGTPLHFLSFSSRNPKRQKGD